MWKILGLCYLKLSSNHLLPLLRMEAPTRIWAEFTRFAHHLGAQSQLFCSVVATAPGYAGESKQKGEEKHQTAKMLHKNFYCHYQKLLSNSSLQSPDYGVFFGWVESSSPSLVYHGRFVNQQIFKELNLISMPPLETRYRMKQICQCTCTVKAKTGLMPKSCLSVAALVIMSAGHRVKLIVFRV